MKLSRWLQLCGVLLAPVYPSAAQFLQVSPNSLNFSQQVLTSSSKTVTLSNPRTGTVTITNIWINANEGFAGFSETNNCGPSLAPGAQCTITVTFFPTVLATLDEFLEVDFTPPTNSVVVSLTGVGTGTAQPQLSTTMLSFGNQQLGTTSAPLSFTVNNLTGNEQTGIHFTMSGPNAAEFVPGTTCGTIFVAGGVCTLSVAFTPAAAGTRSAMVTFSDDSPGSAQSVELSGIGATPDMQAYIDVPGPQSGPFLGLATFSGWAINSLSAISSVTVSIDGAPVGKATYGLSRQDVCAAYPNQLGCPNVGWSFTFDTTMLASGPHTLQITATSASGQNTAVSSTFNVANWMGTAANPMRISIDSPHANTTYNGVAGFGGWAIDDVAAIIGVAISIDGVPYVQASYGGNRPDVCTMYPLRAGCPNVGWNIAVDTTLLADGTHTLAVTATSSAGSHTTVTAPFVVANLGSANPMRISIDQPNAQSGAFSGTSHFGGWALDQNDRISRVTVSVDGVSYSSATYGGIRTDVCAVFSAAPNCPNVGWDLMLDTTTLSNGLHTLDVTAYTSGGEHATAATSFTVSNAAPVNGTRVFIDQPSAQEPTLTGIAQLSGWDIGGNGPLGGVWLFVDDAPIGSAANSVNRPDVCAAFPGSVNCPNVGWNFSLDTTQLAEGTHTLRASAGPCAENTCVNGSADATTTFNVANWTTANPMRVTIDAPVAQSTLSGMATIGGWAIEDTAAIANVTVAVDGVPAGAAVYGIARPDVCNVFPNRPGCPNVGWAYALDTTAWADGTHTLDVTATSTAGRHTTMTTTFKVANLPGSALKITIDIPNQWSAPFSKFATVQGWALDDNAAVASVLILVDGVAVGLATYGQSRPDVCAVFPQGSGCPNVGWTYSLDTTPFANGTHALQVTVTSLNGDRATLSAPFPIAN